MPVGYARVITLPADPAAPGALRVAMTTDGPTLDVVIGFSPPLPGTPLNSPELTVPALIDTGAGECCIDDGVAQQLGLPVVDRAHASGVGGSQEFNVYLGYLTIPAIGKTVAGRFLGVKLSDGGQPHRALIGRTALSETVMAYDGILGIVSISA